MESVTIRVSLVFCFVFSFLFCSTGAVLLFLLAVVYPRIYTGALSIMYIIQTFIC
jgi:hypothetical protein